MREGDPQVRNGRARIGFGHEADVIALRGLHKQFGHTVGLRRAYGRGQGLQADVEREGPRVSGHVRRFAIGQPLDGTLGQ